MLISLLQHLLATISFGILSLKVQRQKSDKNKDQDLRSNRNANARNIVRSVLRSECRCADDTTKSAEADEGSRAEGALPLASDVVCLRR